MKTVTVLVGSARQSHTFKAAESFLARLGKLVDIQGEVVQLDRFRIETCRGCKTCFEKGEEFCPLKDDVTEILHKLEKSDGVVFASPNYAFQVSGILKVFLDRIAFKLHRPCFFGRTFSSIVAQGIHGGNKIRKYLEFIGRCLGFRVSPGAVLTTLEPLTPKAAMLNGRALNKMASRFAGYLEKPRLPTPRLMDLVVFRLSRTGIQSQLTDENRDYSYYREKGWFESEFYYPTPLSPGKKLIGCLVDFLGRRTSCGIS
jgi:multimeric flavodoxin WrbA